MQPDVPLTVSDVEAEDLRAQGLLVEDKAPAKAATAPKAAPAVKED